MRKVVWIGAAALTLLAVPLTLAAVADGGAKQPEAKGKTPLKVRVDAKVGADGKVQTKVTRAGNESEQKQAAGFKVVGGKLIVTAPDGSAVEVVAPDAEANGRPKLSQYWLGVVVTNPDEDLAQQLKLPEGQGLLVHEVMPESPAAKAAIEPDDILLKAGKKALTGPKDLVEAVEEAQGKALKLQLLRGGKKQTLTVTPARRPAQAMPGGPGAAGNAEDWNRIEKWMEQFGEDGGRPSMHWHLMRPGMILPNSKGLSPDLPEDLSVTITKTGKNPAEITVTQGNETWQVKESELDKLPKDVRPHVARMLGRPWIGQLQALEITPKAIPGGQMRLEPLGPPPAQLLQKRLDEMDRRMEEMFKALQQLQQDPDADNVKP